MPDFVRVFCCTLLCFVVLEAVLECSHSHACSGEVVSCQCQDETTRRVLSWLVYQLGSRVVQIYSEVYSTMSAVGIVTARGDYSSVLNNTAPLTSQLTITLTESVFVECSTNSFTSMTLQLVDGE